MTICRYFQQGCCRYGNSCRFEHTYSQNYGNQNQQRSNNNIFKIVNQPQNNVTTEQLINQVTSDTNAAFMGHQWCLSSYCPFKFKPNFPGMLDISPEEVRWQMYEARINGTLPQVETQISQHTAAALEKLKILSKPSGSIINIIESLYRNETPQDPFVNSAIDYNQNANSFGSSNTNVQNQNVFGNTMQNSTAASSLFAEAAKNLFQTPSTTNTFGPSDVFAKPIQNNNFSTFGNGFNQQTSTIDNSSIQQPSVFGPNTNLGNTNHSNNIFSQAQSQSGISPAALFASANNALSQSVSSSENIFSQGNNALTTSNIAENVFAVQNPFGTQTSNPFQASSSNNIFGNTTNNSSVVANVNPFENQTNANVNLEIYSKLEDLTEEDLTAYKSDSFLPGQIPEVPPPLELCD